MIKYSIIVPTYNHLEDCLKPCLQSIIQHTDLQEVEVIVVANGCSDGTDKYVESLGAPFRLLWYPEPLGFTVAINKGIDLAKGEYIILLNNDLQILGNEWINMLVDPFLKDNKVGITGAAKNWHEGTKSEFLLFFCAMIPKKILKDVWIDEVFNPGYGEDIDFCNKLKILGYKIVQVPNDITLNKLRDSHILQFPIWHKSSQTVHSVEGWTDVVKRNEDILKRRYNSSFLTGPALDHVFSWEIEGTINSIMSQVEDDGIYKVDINNRSTLTLAKSGFIHGIFPGKENMDKLKEERKAILLTKEGIKEHVLSCGSKGIWQFGGIFEGGYCLQQDPDEITELLYFLKGRKINNYLEIGAAEGGVTRLICEVADVENICHIDMGWGDMNYPYAYRKGIENLQNTGKIDIFRGDSRSKQARDFLKDRKFDVIFIDADHSYDGVFSDTMLALEHAENGCLFIYHDHVAVDDIAKFHDNLKHELFIDLSHITDYVSSSSTKKGISVFEYRASTVQVPCKNKISIVIPTCTHDNIIECFSSIVAHNREDLRKDLEVVIIANGCEERTKEYLLKMKEFFPVKYTWSDEKIGFIKAINQGIRIAEGDHIILLNDDTLIKNKEWINMLTDPFHDPAVGITGPYKDVRFFWEDNQLIFREEYLVFFCACIRREVIEKVGLLDEDFGWGYEEDIDYCIRARKAGYRIVQVPDNINYSELQYTKEYLIEHPNKNADKFPIYHKDKQTFSKIKEIPAPKNSLLKKYTKPNISIVIPTYNHLELLKPCIESIKKYTVLKNIEVIVVANGCTDETKEYVHSLGEPFKLLWIDEQVGYIKATNAGIRQAMGDNIILLNNDTEVKGDNWIDILAEAICHPNVGLVGPVLAHRDDVKRDYLLFWCVMISREVINKIGLLDEAFGLGYHEDVDYCMRAEDAGFQLVETPNFPIYHKGGGTFAPIYGESEERLLKHVDYLYNKHGINKGNEELPDGWFGWDDQQFYRKLFERLPNNTVAAEIGCWLGRSLCSVADIIKRKNIKVYAIDTFEGSPWEGNHQQSHIPKLISLEYAFTENLRRFGIKDNVTIISKPSSDAAKYIEDDSLDFIFIDGDHRYESVQTDIRLYLPKLKHDAWMTGHDILWNDSVGPAVWNYFGQDKVYQESDIWYVIPENRVRKRKVYDCFTFFNELDVLEIRLNELDSAVDKFVLSESTFTHQGKPKPLYFKENKHRFEKFLHKIHHIVVNEFNDCKTTWDREHYQRNMLKLGLKNCYPDDVIILSDLDEILSTETVRNYKTEMGVCAVEMPLFYYKLDWKIEEKWYKPRIFPFSAVAGKDLQFFRGDGDYVYNHTILNGGWHFSFMGDKESIKQKIQSYAHEEFNNDYYTNDQNIEEAIEQGRDVFRRGLHFNKVEIDSSYPKFVLDNIQDLRIKGLISGYKGYPRYTDRYIYDCFSFYNELDLLEIRLAELDPYVDFFVISEMKQTHSGLPKPLYFEENRERFSKYLHKIIHTVPPDIITNDPWVREHYQRDYMAQLVGQKNENIIIVSDLDEIPKGSRIKEFKDGAKFFWQNQYSYYLNFNVGTSPIAPGTFSRITTWKYLMDNLLSFTALRYREFGEEDGIKDGGWHFSWMGGGEKIADKLEAWAHQEFNIPSARDPKKIEEYINNGKEHLGRRGVGETLPVIIDDSFPKYIQENKEELIKKGFVSSIDIPEVAIVMPYYNDPFLLKSVSAIMGQTYKNWILYIADDGSEELKKASKILASHPKIHIFEKENGGPSSARNYILSNINIGGWWHEAVHSHTRYDIPPRFDYVAFCDSDDIWEPDYLEQQLRNIKDADIIYSSVNHRYDNGEIAVPWGIPDPEEYPGREFMLNTPFIYISSVLCRAKCMKENRFDSRLDSMEDWDMWLRLDEQGYKFKKNNKKLLTYTVKQGMAGQRTEEKYNLLREKHQEVAW